MKKLKLLIASLLVFMFMLTACGSEYSDNSMDNEYSDSSIDNEYNEDENTVAEGEIVGIYTEPLTGARITIPENLKYKTETTGQYGKVIKFMDKESYPSVQMDIKIEEIYVDRIDKAYEKLGFSWPMSGSRLMAYTENYFMVFTETEFFDTTSYEYDWVCLLTDGSVLHLNLTPQSKSEMLARWIEIDFTGAKGEIGLASIYDLSQYEGDSFVAGIWENTENGYWFDCSGGLLFSIYDGEGNMIDCGTYDSVFENLSGQEEQIYYVHAEDGGLSISEFDGIFQLKQTLGIIPGEIPGGIPCEGTQAGEASGELSEYRGKWENDTISCRIEINRGGINFYENYGYSGDSYRVTDEGELALSDGTLIRVQDDGGLTIDGYKGVFYREGEKESVYAPYLGQWYNDVAGQKIWLQDGGGYSYDVGESGYGGSVWSVTGKGTVNIGDDSAYLDEDGNLVIDGYDGVFVLQHSNSN